jgi:hypothetical protein
MSNLFTVHVRGLPTTLRGEGNRYRCPYDHIPLRTSMRKKKGNNDKDVQLILSISFSTV